MNLRKHLAGFAIFSIILGSAIFINYFLAIPNVTVPHIPFDEIVPQASIETPQSVSDNVRLVSLDFINKQSFVRLELKRKAGQPAPGKLWITTLFFASGYPQEVWMSKAEAVHLSANNDRFEYVAAGACDWCKDADAPRDGYFARVYVSTVDGDPALPSDELFNHDIRTAIPVVVQAKRDLHSIP